jgi:hypothetical protein
LKKIYQSLDKLLNKKSDSQKNVVDLEMEEQYQLNHSLLTVFEPQKTETDDHIEYSITRPQIKIGIKVINLNIKY